MQLEVEDLSLAFSFQIPTSYEAVLTARLYLSVKGVLSAWLLLQKLYFKEWIFQGRPALL